MDNSSSPMKRNHNAFTLVEVLVAAIIFALAATGLFTAFSTQGAASGKSERRLMAVYYGRQLLEDLRNKVDNRTSAWPLTCDNATHLWPGATPPISGMAATYSCDTIAAGRPGEGSRKVTLNVQWTEP